MFKCCVRAIYIYDEIHSYIFICTSWVYSHNVFVLRVKPPINYDLRRHSQIGTISKHVSCFLDVYTCAYSSNLKEERKWAEGLKMKVFMSPRYRLISRVRQFELDTESSELSTFRWNTEVRQMCTGLNLFHVGWIFLFLPFSQHRVSTNNN